MTIVGYDFNDIGDATEYYPGMNLPDQMIELPEQRHACLNLIVSAAAGCQEAGGNPAEHLHQRRACIRHFLEQGREKYRLAPEDIGYYDSYFTE